MTFKIYVVEAWEIERSHLDYFEVIKVSKS